MPFRRFRRRQSNGGLVHDEFRDGSQLRNGEKRCGRAMATLLAPSPLPLNRLMNDNRDHSHTRSYAASIRLLTIRRRFEMGFRSSHVFGFAALQTAEKVSRVCYKRDWRGVQL
jgi:hypothetical protein